VELGVEGFVLLREGVFCFLKCQGFPIDVSVYEFIRVVMWDHGSSGIRTMSLQLLVIDFSQQ
jgi:hypothetical protein